MRGCELTFIDGDSRTDAVVVFYVKYRARSMTSEAGMAKEDILRRMDEDRERVGNNTANDNDRPYFWTPQLTEERFWYDLSIYFSINGYVKRSGFDPRMRTLRPSSSRTGMKSLILMSTTMRTLSARTTNTCQGSHGTWSLSRQYQPYLFLLQQPRARTYREWRLYTQ